MTAARPATAALRVAIVAALALASSAALFSPVVAQAEGAGESSQGGFHLRGRPKPECASFLITELGAGYLLNENSSYTAQRSTLVTADLGYMMNLGSRDAGGLVLDVAADDRREAVGGGARYRRWFGGSRSLNLTVGAAFSGASDEGGTGDLKGISIWGEAGFAFGDYASVVLRVQDWQSSRQDPVSGGDVHGGETTWHLGLKIGALPGAVLLGVTTLMGGPPALAD